MLSLNNEAALDRALTIPLDPALERLLVSRRDQLVRQFTGYELGELVQFIVVQPGDTVTTIEAAARYPVITAPAFEWVVDHGGWFESATILSDDGFGLLLLCPDTDAVDPTILKLLRKYAEDFDSCRPSDPEEQATTAG